MPEAVLAKVFAQANTIKGFRYLDDAGKVMNQYDEAFPEKSVGVNGLTMRAPAATFDEARVSSQEIWASFSRPGTLTLVRDQVAHYWTTVSDIIGVVAYKRLGLRAHYVVEANISTASVMERAISATMKGPVVDLGLPTAKTFEAMLHFAPTEGLGVQVRLSPVQLVDDAADSGLPKAGLLLDADVSREGTLRSSDIRAFLRQATTWLDENCPALATSIMEAR